MKKFVLCVTVLFFVVVKPKAQILLNEIYTDPGAGNHEFFELYNTSNATTPYSLDNFTIITFFDLPGQKGFYVMDLPNLTINPRGFFVGSSAIPFNFQSTAGSIASDFDWNSVAFTSNNGYLKKWVKGTANVIDGNPFYDQAALPVDFNDFFYRRTAAGASYTVFLYNNGQLINTFIGGTGGSATIITEIVNMPPLVVDMVNPLSTDFNVDFSLYSSIPLEYCTQDAGSDNGYIRERDGVCALWDKSSAGVQHSPEQTNGGTADQFTGSIAVSSAISQGTATTGSTVTYDVVSALSGSFPVELEVYLDKGTVIGKIDAGDIFIETKSQSALSDPPLTTHYFPYNSNILIVVKSSAGCIDKIQFLAGANVLSKTKFNFQGSYNNGKIVLNWDVSQNEDIDRFELEKSNNGKDFTTVALILGSEKVGKENYALYENASTNQKVFYRLKVINNVQKAEYSTVLVFETKLSTGPQTSILVTNPVMDKLTVRFTSSGEPATLNVYDMNGRKIISQKVNAGEGTHIISIPVPLSVKSGMYIAEINTGAQNYTSKFIKQ